MNLENDLNIDYQIESVNNKTILREIKSSLVNSYHYISKSKKEIKNLQENYLQFFRSSINIIVNKIKETTDNNFKINQQSKETILKNVENENNFEELSQIKSENKNYFFIKCI